MKDAVTGRPLPNAVITTKNVTRVNASHAREDIIKHDITSGEALSKYNYCNWREWAFDRQHASWWSNKIVYVWVFSLFDREAQDGDYWRLLTPGEYELTATVKNYVPLTRRVLVTNPFHEEAYIVNFELKPFTNEVNWVSFTYTILV